MTLLPLYEFPAVETALSEPNGLLVAGGDLSPDLLISAYLQGIFPWFNEDEPILWWSPDPRMILVPNQFQVSKSLKKVLQRKVFEVRFDTAFSRVMQSCAAPRKNQAGTWIHPQMIQAYTELHHMGYAHSVECWLDNQLVGGLYGIALGRMFYGESMFAEVSNASKVALAYLCKQLARWDFELIDCQMNTQHLASLGAHEIPRSEFIQQLKQLTQLPAIPVWQFDADLFT